jgi:hypothetical protein
MVCGDIADQPLGMDAEDALPAGAGEPGRSNGLAWLEVPDCADDDFEADFDEVNDCKASHTDDAAPRVNSMTELRRNAARRGLIYSKESSASAVPRKKDR